VLAVAAIVEGVACFLELLLTMRRELLLFSAQAC
jgi:hypothetical protein